MHFKNIFNFKNIELIYFLIFYIILIYWYKKNNKKSKKYIFKQKTLCITIPNIYLLYQYIHIYVHTNFVITKSKFVYFHDKTEKIINMIIKKEGKGKKKEKGKRKRKRERERENKRWMIGIQNPR